MQKLQRVHLHANVILPVLILCILSQTGRAGAELQGIGAKIEPEEVTNVYLPYLNFTDIRNIPESTWLNSWAMAGANPERTSWTAEEVRGKLKPVWVKPIEPYIPMKVQVIAAYGNLYISTSAGLYVLDAETGSQKWVYPTEMPLGHSPTIFDGIAYVGGFDHKIHAVDALTGSKRWTYEASKGFNTSPLVVDGKLYAGNRDGYFYAIHTDGPKTGQLAWKYQTQGPILFSAAYKDGVVYFASNDSHAYALDALNGNLVWKSDKLPGAGFHSWWPVVYRDWVIFAGSNNYRFSIEPGPAHIHILDRNDVYPNYESDPQKTLVGPLGEEPGDWAAGTPTINTSRPTITANGSTVPITEYFEQKPWRRTYFVLSRTTGKEYTTDFDQDGKAEYAPFLWFGSDGAGNRYPPMVGSDGVVYQPNNYYSDKTLLDGHITGWKIGTPHISLTTFGSNAVDEPVAYAGGGSLIYWNRCCDRVSGAIDISQPATSSSRSAREWTYFSYDLPGLIPGYNLMTYAWDPYYKPYGGVYGGRNGSYGWHGDVNPPIPYQGKLFMHRSNAILAFSPQENTPVVLPTASRVEAGGAQIPALSEAQLKSLLAAEVQKVLDAGHLRPGYLNTGHFDKRGQAIFGDDLGDYWHYPGDILVTLIRALPHLSPDMQGTAKTYLQAEFTAFPPYEFNHTGWKDGAARELFDLPPEVEEARTSYNPKSSNSRFTGWNFAPHQFYAMWKYAQVFGGAKAIFDASQKKLEPVPANEILLEMPHVHNAYIAGYIGYLELQKMAGYPESAAVRQQLDQLLVLRAGTFTKDAHPVYFLDEQKFYGRALNVSRNFMYLVPELAQYLHDNIPTEVQEAVEEYTRLAPYWFVSRTETAFGEDTINHLYDYHSLFQAKALILKEPRNELLKYLDVPGVAVGDLFYMENLVALIEASGP